MSPELSTENPPLPPKLLQHPNRQLAWYVAPNLSISFKYAWAGLSYTFRTQRNFRIHVVVGTLAIALGLYVHLSRVEIAVITIMSGFVLAMELINTALESVVDLTVKQTYHDLAKTAKDAAAGAVLMAAIASVIVATVILAPPLMERLAPLLPL